MFRCKWCGTEREERRGSAEEGWRRAPVGADVFDLCSYGCESAFRQVLGGAGPQKDPFILAPQLVRAEGRVSDPDLVDFGSRLVKDMALVVCPRTSALFVEACMALYAPKTPKGWSGSRGAEVRVWINVKQEGEDPGQQIADRSYKLFENETAIYSCATLLPVAVGEAATLGLYWSLHTPETTVVSPGMGRYLQARDAGVSPTDDEDETDEV